MGTLTKILLVLIVLAVAGTAAFLAFWDIPAPTHPVVREIPGDKLGR